ncbi:uncharacterized protein SPPG_05120 [Spizellomyces punctatus DAOM BR117]|uniref:AMP-dependent synthetase/ligase domain-containing protein n=1 Tax=Spizellomyces punctatus (strain DAOM BR117) TaxID=645134 RepID=A0A0L0HE60_SPIPD|nr:uncharacterized protein SPPG_05120 [Spizellomyces punctatus DAOM BR117]KNC99740.1 hypothetical protein SPPG_05120 [Spizellomyces punctatus DAOM BR117]|eukprot:XP_016607780.1 hypothetical protein SPPG_05120 [Spizellomyces punctatus DAOM BR117]
MTIPQPRYTIPEKLAIEVPGAPAIPGEGKPRCHYLTFEREYRVKQFGSLTAWDIFEEGRRRSGDAPCLGRRTMINGVAGPFVWETYNEVYTRAERIASALVALGHQPNDKVGIFAKNCPEYAIAQFAAFRQGGTVVPIYDTLVSDEAVLVHMLNLTECKVVFTTSKQVPVLLSASSKVPTLKIVVTFDEPSDEQKKQAEILNVELLTFPELEKLGAKELTEPNAPKGGDIAWICFTSGTTGMPKGAIITHKMCSSIYDRVALGIEHGLDLPLTPDDVMLSYLPMAHVFEMSCQTVVIGHGGRIGFWQGDVTKLMNDVAELKPTIFAGTPRIYNRIYDSVMAQVSKAGWAKAALFHTAYNGKLTWLSRNMYNHALWDKVVFAKLRELLGGRVRFMYTGAAPISREVLDFLKIAFSCPVIEGYGQTESMTGTSITYPCDTKSAGTIGVPIPGVYIKLVDVPDMNYLSSSNPPAGEICFKGCTAFPGYYKDEEKTKETIDEDGWVHTGDIGIWTEHGNLKIVDRKKNLFKLAQGEYVSPEKVENAYSRHELVDSIFVTGESTQAHLVAIIHPSKAAFVNFVTEKVKDVDATLPLEELCENKVVRKTFLQEVSQWVRRSGELKGFEIVKDVVLEPKDFPSLGFLTPTFKLKRHDAKLHYKAKVAAMYDGTSSVM